MTLNYDMNIIKQVLEKELRQKRVMKEIVKTHYIELTEEIREFELQLNLIPDILQRGSMSLEIALLKKNEAEATLVEYKAELKVRVKENAALLEHISELENQIQEDIKQTVKK